MAKTEAQQAETRSADINVQGMMQMMDVVDALRQQQQLVDRELSRDAQAAEIKQRLQATYRQMGTDVEEAALEKAINDHFSHRYAFTPPRPGFGYRLAQAYVDRARLGRTYGVPVLMAGVVGVGIYGGVELIRAVRHHLAETSAEKAAAALYQERQGLEREIKSLSGFPGMERMPQAEQKELLNILELAGGETQATDNFFNEFCADGTCEDDITQENYTVAKVKLAQTASDLKAARQHLIVGKGLQQTHLHLGQTAQNLESLIAGARTEKLDPTFLGAAETAYRRGVEEVQKRNLLSATRERDALQRLIEDGRQYHTLVIQVDQQYQAIKKLAQEPAALAQAEHLYQSAAAHKEARTVPLLQQVTAQLQELNTALAQEYEVRIVSKPGVKSGIWRYPHDNPGAKNYYLVVEAIGTDGAPVSLSITSEEDQTTRTVSMWGERVTEAAYEKVKNDKLDDGIIQQKVAGRKQRGYLKPEYDASFSVQGGKITAGW